MFRNDKLYGFVILHYMAFDMTTKCVTNLLDRFGNYNIRIVIVDNASPNGSGQKLMDYYNDNNLVSIIINHENLGFANGNNVGYRYVNEKFNPDYVVVMNNDVLINQDEFLDLVDFDYFNDDYSVLGPDIYCKEKEQHQNPAHKKLFTLNELYNLEHYYSKLVKHPAFYYWKDKIAYSKIVSKVKGRDQKVFAENVSAKDKNVVLHGACYVFSKNFISKKENCFCPRTFMYFEEDILAYECIRNNMKIVYDPELKVEHLEDVSTNLSFSSEFNKYKMKNFEFLKSVRVLIDMINKDSTQKGR